MNKRVSFISRVALSATILMASLPLNLLNTAHAATLTSASATLSDSRISQTSTYTLQFSGIQTVNTKCFKIQFATTATGTTIPTGMTIPAMTSNVSGTYTSSIAPSAFGTKTVSSGLITISDTSGGTAAASGTIVLANITNSSTAGSAFFIQFSTYSDSGCTTALDNVTIAYINTNGQLVTATVDPTLTFTVTGVASGTSAGIVGGASTTVTTTSTTIPFGTVTTASNTRAAQTLAVATNGNGGYSVTARYSTANGLYNGSHTWTNQTGTNGTPTAFPAAGVTEAWGYHADDTSLSVTGAGAGRFGTNNVWAGLSDSTPSEILFSSVAASETFMVEYQAGITATTAAGSYSTTIIYAATSVY